MSERSMTMKSIMAFTAGSFFPRLVLAAAIVLLCALLGRAGGPKYVAGSSYFNSATMGQPIVWSQGVVTYYTDQGDLSPILPNASANSFVASAFSIWTAVPTAAISVTSGGQLAENVTGSNIAVNSEGVITAPADITPSATNKPVGIVYDYDGSVTDALLGAGAGDSGECFFNAVYGGADNFSSEATFLHALIVINGQCALQSSQLTDVEYRLVRVMGEVLGVGWSQLNVNVQTGSPPPTPADYAGFPIMHFTDSWDCVPITLCYPNPYQLSMDDAASLSRLYPVTAQNQSSFPGSHIFSATTARIHGSVWFTNPQGNSTQAMEGVNVVARWIDPSTGQPSRQYAASAVSGFLFGGNAGNPITGLDDALGNPFSEWGSNNQTVEGFYDLAGLAPPNNSSTQYQLSVEGLNPSWSSGVGPYSPGPVAPSGSPDPITVTVTVGSDVEQDILMTGSAQPIPQPPSSWTIPAALPLGGDWISTLTGYGDVPYFFLTAQANRTLSVAVTALDETGSPSEAKAQPVIGMWNSSDPQGTPPPAFTPSPFNQIPFALTRLDAQVLSSASFLIGISDVRGDGRPDYAYHAHVLYANTVTPARVSVNGGAVTIHGVGFFPSLASTVGSSPATQLAVDAGQMILAAPAFPDGPQNITLTDPVSGSSTTMTVALTYGAASTDTLKLLSGTNPSTPVGTQAISPMRVQALASDGVTPVSGATIEWSSTNGVHLSACSGTTSCSVLSDQDGYALTWLTPAATGSATITATLAPGVYSPSSSVSVPLTATESSSGDIGVYSPYQYVSQGSSVTLPLTAIVLNKGTPQNNKTVNFSIVTGGGTLSAPSAPTNSSGIATVQLSLPQIAALVQIAACVAPADAPCASFYINPVPLAQQNLQQVSGAGQVTTGQAFQPIVVRVTDSSPSPNPVIAAPVVFQTTVLRPGGNGSMPVILQVTQNSVASNSNGLASIVPSAGTFSPPLEVGVQVSAGASASITDPLEVLPP
jgi:hypothetical protein